MKRSPLNNSAHGSRPYGARHTPYMNWKSHENACGRGYQFVDGNSYPRFYASNTGSQSHDGDFIPLNVSTPLTQYDKYNTANRYSPFGGRGSPSSGWCNNYRGNYHATPRSNKRNPAYKHSPKQFQGQIRKDYKGAHRQVNISAYVDMNSFLEDPWRDLIKKLDDSKDIRSKSKGPESESLSSSKLVDTDLLDKSKSQLSKDMNLGDSRCSQENRNECSEDTTFETNTSFSQISKINSLIESETGDVCFSQDSLNKNSVSDTIYGAIQENSLHSNASLTNIEQKTV
ncbi:PREDICTED: uncharacterized protein LOC108750515 isoform X2 [Trachymyrmex septentrionalis]|uniref:uncharacterized protein LOC108750515 isoform X2 n=1 Tax=Trachymyrmex septentrionalis TaxID=34720 RepID=UPI00084EEBE6|nr:PREDICTED: uncharacterized protein LOC108750515 isoform X2 [Trachymyrmex septentrionalis]